MRIARAGSLLLTAGLLGALATTPAGASGMGTPADAVENFATDGTELLAPEMATIERRDDGVTIDLRLATPEAGTYTYPETVESARQVQPELFTGWAFVFNHPELCEVPHQCGPQDQNEQVQFGVYNFAGVTNQLEQHSMGDITLNPATDGYVALRGDIASGQTQLDMPPGVVTFPLENPMGAEIHAAIAPHGQLDISTIGTEIYAPVGNPSCGCWWVAIFRSPEAADVAAN